MIFSIWMSGGWKSPEAGGPEQLFEAVSFLHLRNGEGRTNHSLNRHHLEGKGEGIFMGESADNQLIIS
jgi:hypothetical protein